MEHTGDTCNRYRDDLRDCFHTKSLLFDVVVSPATCAGRDPRAPPQRAMLVLGLRNGHPVTRLMVVRLLTHAPAPAPLLRGSCLAVHFQDAGAGPAEAAPVVAGQRGEAQPIVYEARLQGAGVQRHHGTFLTGDTL